MSRGTSASTFLEAGDRISIQQADPPTVTIWMVCGPDMTVHLPDGAGARRALALDLLRAGGRLLDIAESGAKAEDIAAIEALPF